ncbi:MAG TPA: AI-2E family transporter [Abditibacteriaceae bacterium]|nr:AI-2E family transporter [Abditibacteriaceae bacterium]
MGPAPPDSASPGSESPDSASQWTNRRILTLLALGTFIVSLIWRLPEEVGYLSRHAGEIIFALVIAMALTYLLRPAVNALHRLRLFGAGSHSGRAWATLAVFMAAAGLLYFFVLIGLKPVVMDVREMWDSFVPRSPEAAKALISQWKGKLAVAIEPYQAMLPPETTGEIQQAVPRLMAGATRSIGRWLSHSFSHAGFIIELILIPVLVFYFLTDGPALRAEARLLAPPAWRPRAGRMMAHFDRVLDGYTRGQVIMCLLAWVLVTGGLLLLGVPHAFTLGLIAGITRAVPVIGPILGGVPLVLVCLLTTLSLPITLTLLIGFTAMHFLESKVLLPKIVGHEVDLHPVSVIVALLLGMEFFGFLGVFLAVPLAAVLKIALAEWHAGYPHPSGAASLAPSAPTPSAPALPVGDGLVAGDEHNANVVQ